MNYSALVAALIVVLGTFVYTVSFILQLFTQKAWRGVVGVSLLALLELAVPVYVLFFL
ncbi:MAG TPA: hypothetical protein VHS59_09670 [Bacillota bacterium]|nr:hypothetical protein [Bacillota bacterium]